jgi:hypothetical protein
MRTISALLTIVVLLGCTPAPIKLAASTVAFIVANKVSDGVFGKIIFDPVWEALVGKPSEEELKSLKNDFVKEATKSVIEALIPNAHAAEGAAYTCEPREELQLCQQRVAEAARIGFDAYAPKFVAAWETCRDDIVLTPSTGALDQTEQIRLINHCVGNKGFQREMAVIMAHVQRRG